jgi:hypothetical protein
MATVSSTSTMTQPMSTMAQPMSTMAQPTPTMGAPPPMMSKQSMNKKVSAPTGAKTVKKGGRRRTQHMYRGGYRYARKYSGGQSSKGNNSGTSGNTTNGQRTSRPPAYFPNPGVIQQYHGGKEYKRDDFVTSERKDVSYIVLADSVTGKEPKENPTEFKEIPAYEGSVDKSYNEGDLIIFGNDHIIYQRIDSSNPELPYQAGQDPDGNPYAWLLRAIHEGMTAPKYGNNSGKKGNNSGATNVKIARAYNDTTEYKHDDIVGGVDGQFYLVLTDSVTGKEPSTTPNEFKLIPRMTSDNASELGELAVGDVVYFVGSTSAQNYFFYKRIQPDGGQTPYEVGQTPDTNPYAWKAVARVETANDAPAASNAPTPVASNAPTPVASNAPAGEIQDFDNFKTYTANDLIRYKSEVGNTPYEGKLYKMTVPIGAAGYAPFAYPTHFVEMIEGPNGLQEAPTTTVAEAAAAAAGGARRRTRRKRDRKTRRRRGSRRH